MSSVNKTQKYDRQLRLWGEHGQEALEKASVCLINGTPTGTEILKNLILPGVGSFTVIDGKFVEGRDLGNNFFLEKKNIGKPRAACVTELLQELNRDVRGRFVQSDPIAMIESNINFFKDYTIVIANSVPEAPLRILASYLYIKHIPLLIVRAYGLLGYMRLVVDEHQVIEAHPDSAVEDLRISEPFEELSAFADNFNLSTLSDKEHKHVPYPIILLKLIKKWKSEHNNKPIKTPAEKAEIRKLIESTSRNILLEENFTEAKDNAHKAWVPYSISSNVKAIFEDEKCNNIKADSSPFWIVARAVKDFAANEGGNKLPLMGTLPDMTSTTEYYIALQKIYQEKALRDTSVVTKNVYDTLNRLNKSVDSISSDYIKLFCKNVNTIDVIKYRSLESEYSNETPNTAIVTQLQNADEIAAKNAAFYILLRAVDRFYAVHLRYPGSILNGLDSDIPLLKIIVDSLISELGTSSALIKDDYIHEICRFGASELHSIASILGGVGSQEVIKLITKQFLPCNNTFIFNGVNSTTSSTFTF